MKLAISLFLGAAIATANPKEDYMSFMNDFMKNTQLSFEFTIVQNSGPKTLVSKGYYKRSANQFTLKNENYLVISNSDVTLTVFEKDKIILLDEPKPANNLFVIDLANMKEAITKVTEYKQVNGIKEWHVQAKGWEGKAVVKADIDKMVPIQIEVFYKDANLKTDKPITNFSFFNVSKIPLSKDLFSISSFIYRKDNQWMLTQKYLKYELINNVD